MHQCNVTQNQSLYSLMFGYEIASNWNRHDRLKQDSVTNLCCWTYQTCKNIHPHIPLDFRVSTRKTHNNQVQHGTFRRQHALQACLPHTTHGWSDPELFNNLYIKTSHIYKENSFVELCNTHHWKVQNHEIQGSRIVFTTKKPRINRMFTPASVSEVLCISCYCHKTSALW